VLRYFSSNVRRRATHTAGGWGHRERRCASIQKSVICLDKTGNYVSVRSLSIIGNINGRAKASPSEYLANIIGDEKESLHTSEKTARGSEKNIYTQEGAAGVPEIGGVDRSVQ